ncbi:PAS domain-containing protein [Kiloniella sp.]|uniref:PAS domain-containing protein n=1 Tax=Kiloniella sp. TaxID=1938587 RepID=UPI003B01B10A
MTNLKLLHTYWSKKKGNNWFPGRKDIDPVDFPYALGDVSLIDVIRTSDLDAPQFKVRLLGSNIQERVGGSFTNRDIDDFPEQDSLNRMRIAYQDVLKTKEPVAYPSFFKVGEDYRAFICCIWPLSNDGDNVDMLLCCREKITEEQYIPDRTGLYSQHPTWPYQDWATNKLLNKIAYQ